MKTDARKTPAEGRRITLRSLVFGAIFSGVFAVVTAYFENRRGVYATSTQISVLSYLLLLVCVLMVNPMCRVIRIVRRFSVAEILVIFIMCSVSAAVSTFGLASQLVPVVGGLFNKDWNNEQSRWDLYVEPHMNDRFFIAEPGTTGAARRSREVELALREAEQIARAAAWLKKAEAQFDLEKSSLEKVRQMADEKERADAEAGAAYRYAVAEITLKKARARWEQYGSQHDAQDVIETFPARIAELEAEVKRRRDELAEIEKDAFAKVAVFRKGLPEDMSAFPGFITRPGEDLAGYVRRLKRVVRGISALGRLRRAEAALAGAEAERAPPEVLEQVRAAVQSAINHLEPSAAAEELEAQQQALAEEQEATQAQAKDLAAQLYELRTARRYSDLNELKRVNGLIDDLTGESMRLTERQKECGRTAANVKAQLKIVGIVAATVADLRALEQGLEGSPALPAETLGARLASIRERFPSFDASLRRFVIGDVPWSQWLMPLVNWGIVIALTYTVLMTLNVLVFRQWAHNEKLMYPLAKLPEVLAGAEENGADRWVPGVFRNGLFWAGAGVSTGVMGWNLLCHTNRVPGLSPIALYHWWGPFVWNSPFAALGGESSNIYFLMIGLAFMIPPRISFSLWFFYILYMVQLLVLTWAGYSLHWRGWWYDFNFQTAEGGGALIVFAGFVLFRCRQYFLCGFRPSLVQDLDPAERRELRTSSVLFFGASAGLILILWLCMGANPFYAVLCHVVLLALTIGLTRAVAEGGIPAFQPWTTPFHFIRTVFGMDKTWSAPPLMAPLMVYYGTLFLDLKTFIAPSMANSIKIRDDAGMGRFRFHAAVFLGILIAAVVAVTVHIMLAYDKGASSGMNWWFYSGFPNHLFQTIAVTDWGPPSADPSCRLWLVFGAAGMAALLYFGRFLLWLPHPLGFVMLINPWMGGHWFSILIGWAARSLVTKYGSKETYAKVRNFFIGLIVGELVIVILAMIVGQLLGMTIPIDLNR